jgi:hypothetical protein
MKAAAGIKLSQKSASLPPKDELWVWTEIYQCLGKKMQNKKCGMPQESTPSVVWVTNSEGEKHNLWPCYKIVKTL